MAWILHLPRKIPTYASGSDAVPPIPAARARGIAIEKKGGF
ncbi:hypothetical protein [Burkholderia pseudomultivorans]|nr:hypothetical protein [Burkholderia pseudomultivorans]EGD03355.1 hypothetical protein B1M_16830 [Burkholderia sp. TJI49]